MVTANSLNWNSIPGNSVHEALHNFHRADHQPTVEEVPDDDNNGADVPWGLCDSVENMDTPGPEQEELDEDGLRAYERLSETFERQLEEIGE